MQVFVRCVALCCVGGQAKTMARYAFEVSRGAVRGVVETPFSKQAQEEMNMVYSGGKLDDITVVVGKVYPGS